MSGSKRAANGSNSLFALKLSVCERVALSDLHRAHFCEQVASIALRRASCAERPAQNSLFASKFREMIGSERAPFASTERGLNGSERPFRWSIAQTTGRNAVLLVCRATRACESAFSRSAAPPLTHLFSQKLLPPPSPPQPPKLINGKSVPRN